MARIVFALDDVDVQTYFNSLILSYEGSKPRYKYLNPEQYTFQGLLQIYGIAALNFNEFTVYPIEVRAANYVNAEVRMTQFMTNYGAINDSVNLCRWVDWKEFSALTGSTNSFPTVK